MESLLLVLFKRFMGKSGKADRVAERENEAPEMIVSRIQKGDTALQESFIASYRPYIAKVTSRFCKRYIDPSRDDEFSIALSAFHEAIGQFSAEAGRSFLGFAETVIRRRLIDYVRKEQRHSKSVPYSSFESQDEEDTVVNRIEQQQALQQFNIDSEADERRLEIGDFNMLLSGYGISFSELVDVSPKHADSRRMLIDIARQLAMNETLFEQLRSKKQLPIKELIALCGVSRKTLERNRKYIIALANVLNGSFPYLQSYLEQSDDNIKAEEGVGT
ncbi:RNA polymerase sigma factor SigI [Paenibacillus abyssi]|uniref:RNA polymerase sigma factor SigI n=1 Tax=Paenibacillus abyssi TaxID=1340531 RepID=UPI0036089E25